MAPVHAGLKRRHFLRALGTAAVAIAAAPLAALAPKRQGLVFHKDAFAAVIATPRELARFDVIYGWVTLHPEVSARVTG